MVIIFVILTLIIALSIEHIISRQRKSSSAVSIADFPIFNKSSIMPPQGYLISKYHTWAMTEGKSIKVGIDNFAVKARRKHFY